MQDLHAVVGGRMFDAAAMERRLRPLSHHHAIKCPRCDSLNTKFCYYNNYNLSQPRHFCKGCRRYWTKGGVLRNVPVGGGCRKNNKRSKVKISPAKTADKAATTAVTSQQIDRKSTSQYSSSESSGYTTAAAEASAGLINTTLEYVAKTNSGGACFSHGALTDIGGLIAAAVSEPIPGGFNFSNRELLSQQSQDTCHQNQWQQQDQIPGTFLDRTVQVDLAALQSGFVPFDWQPCKDQSGVDLASGAVVDQPYWSQSQIQWTTDNSDHPGLYLP